MRTVGPVRPPHARPTWWGWGLPPLSIAVTPPAADVRRRDRCVAVSMLAGFSGTSQAAADHWHPAGAPPSYCPACVTLASFLVAAPMYGRPCLPGAVRYMRHTIVWSVFPSLHHTTSHHTGNTFLTLLYHPTSPLCWFLTCWPSPQSPLTPFPSSLTYSCSPPHSRPPLPSLPTPTSLTPFHCTLIFPFFTMVHLPPLSLGCLVVLCLLGGCLCLSPWRGCPPQLPVAVFLDGLPHLAIRHRPVLFVSAFFGGGGWPALLCPLQPF